MSVTLKQIIESTIKVAEENPEFVYNPDGVSPRCHYTSGPDDDTQRAEGCLFGMGMMRAGVPREVLHGHGSAIDGVLGDLMTDGHVEEAPNPEGVLEVFDLLSDEQISQDKGAAWGQCVPGLRKALARTEALA